MVVWPTYRSALWGFGLLCLSANGQVAPSQPAGIGHTRSINGHHLHSPGSSFGPTGQGEIIYQWEAPPDSNPYQTFADSNQAALSGRIEYLSDSAVFSSHATEMALIMAGQSSDTAQAGLAPQAQLRATGIRAFADSAARYAQQDMALALHAYAENYGWNNGFWFGLEEIDSTEDYNWGRYDAQARIWDQLAFQNPHYLAIRSAGNSRGESQSGSHTLFQSVNGSTSQYVEISSSTPRDPDGGTAGWDCLPPISTAKNALIVGAVDLLPKGYTDSSSVRARPGSAFGPPDDGRIKPDLVAGGERTSQSAAAVAGGMALLSELFRQIWNRPPLSSTLHAVAVNSTREAGPHPGPDYRYGHGLLDLRRAANTLQAQNSIEDTLQAGDTAVYYLHATGDTVRVTLAWTDPAGTPVSFLNDPLLLDNPAPMLVHDLDVELVDLAGRQRSFPYTLNVSQPSRAAQVARNRVDNVERIQRPAARGEWLKLVISHHGILAQGSQAFSLVYDQARPAMIFKGQWLGGSPSAHSGRYDAYIMPQEQVTLPAGFQLHDVTIGAGASVTIP